MNSQCLMHHLEAVARYVHRRAVARVEDWVEESLLVTALPWAQERRVGAVLQAFSPTLTHRSDGNSPGSKQQKLGLKDSLGWVQILTVSIISTYVLSGTQFILLHRTRIQHYSRYCASNYAILKEWSEERLVELLLKLFTLKSKKGNWLQIATCWPYDSDFIMLDVCNGLDKPSIRQAEVSGETYHMLGALSMKMPLGCTLKSSHVANKNISWSQHECSSCSIAVCQSRHHMRLQIEPPETRNDDCVSLLQNWDLAFCSNSPLLKRLRWILLSGSVWTAVNHRCFGWDEGFKVWVVRSQYSSWTFERSMNCMNDRY